ncbi:uncharacterized protein LOC143344070 [Colletes latitarsis]|uniref:uncharacterized protein LOC143344070 n=1 Tax=Colletes latitarsis TaxID=2605962 RepID=UPI0040355BB9
MKRCLMFLVPVLVVVLATFHSTMAEKIDPPFPCKTDQDCPVFSNTFKDVFCKDGFCVCKNGTENRNCSSTEIIRQSNRNAEKGSLVSHTCKINQDCKISNSFCNTTVLQCECLKNYVFSSNRKSCLEKVAGIDFPCIDDNQCIEYLANTTCQNGHCNCVTGYHLVQDVCYKTTDFKKPCTRFEECSLVEGATCTGKKICDCPAETVIDTTKNRCLPVVREISGKCTENVQCSTTFRNSVCIEQQCFCQDGYHFEPEMLRCFVDVGLDKNCANKYECYQPEEKNVTTKAVECVENVCECAENFYREGNRCVDNGGTRFVGSLISLFLAIFFHIVFCRQN